MPKRMGFEGKLYYGTAGSTAATELTIVRDVSYGFDAEYGDTSDRASIINMSDVVGINFDIEFEVLNNDDNAFVATARAAAAAGTPLAIKTDDISSGWGVDGDFVFSLAEQQPLRDKQTIRFTGKPTDSAGRLPSWA